MKKLATLCGIELIIFVKIILHKNVVFNKVFLMYVTCLYDTVMTMRVSPWFECYVCRCQYKGF